MNKRLLIVAAIAAAVSAGAWADSTNRAAQAGVAAAVTSDVTTRAQTAFEGYIAAWNTGGETREGVFADDAALEYPVARAGWVLRAEGKDAIEARIAARAQTATNWQFTLEAVYPTLHDHIVFVQYQGQAIDPATGQALTQRYLAEVTMAGGEIATLREFSNPGGPLNSLAGDTGFIGTGREIR